MRSYLRTLLDPANSVPILIIGNLGAVLTAIATYCVDAPMWTALPICASWVVVSPIVVALVRQRFADAASILAIRPLHEALDMMIDRVLGVIARFLPGLSIGRR